MAKIRKRKVKLTKRKAIIYAILAVAVIAAALLLGLLKPEGDTDTAPKEVSGELQVHFIDVGQGDCILVMSEGEYMLVDTGDIDDECTEKIIDYLNGFGIKTIDYLVLTHPDADHIGGAPEVIGEFDVEKCIMPDYDKKTTKIYERTLDALEQTEVDVVEAVPGDEFSVGEADCKIIAPLKAYDDANDASVVIRMTFGEISVLLTGDAESESEADIVKRYKSSELECDVLKSGHHGSSTSSSSALLDAVSPKYAVISCGAGNSYGHPHTETTEKYESRKITVYRTDRNGTVVMKSDGEKVTFTTEK